MALQDNGSQHISYKYRFPAKGEDFSQSLRGILKPGFYYGGELSNVGNEITITPFKVVLNSEDHDAAQDNKVIILETESNATVTASDITKDYLCVTYTWESALNVFADFQFRASSGIVLTNEVIVGTCTYDASGLVSINTDDRTYGFFDENYSVNIDRNLDVENLATIGSGIVEGNLTVNGLLNAVVSKSIYEASGIASYTILDDDGYDEIQYNATDSSGIVRLPTLADNSGRSIIVGKTDSTSNKVIVAPEGNELINNWNSTFEITEQGGQIEFKGISDKWLATPLNDACIYETRTESTIVLTTTLATWEDVITLSINAGNYDLRAEMLHYFVNSSIADNVSLFSGISTVTGNSAPDIKQVEYAFNCLNDDIESVEINQISIVEDYETASSITLRLKSYYNSDETATSHSALASAVRPILLRAIRKY